MYTSIHVYSIYSTQVAQSDRSIDRPSLNVAFKSIPAVAARAMALRGTPHIHHPKPLYTPYQGSTHAAEPPYTPYKPTPIEGLRHTLHESPHESTHDNTVVDVVASG